ncbi:MAG TPA: hypothetical protein VMC83_00170 [Streptosporangiaceae bacterium]|nr:hypothetical protein [Streptosporangiaceae bacterium]
MSTDLPGHRPDDLSGDVPGEHLGDFVSSEPGLQALLGMLAADATPDELAGEGAALAMFRASGQPTRPFEPLAFGPPAAEPRFLEGPHTPGARITRTGAPGGRGPRRQGRRVGLMAAAVTLAAAAGFAVAAYTEALPSPLQQAAYQVLGFAGVPAAHHTAPNATSSRAPGKTHGHGPSHQPGPSASASAQPSSSSPVTLTGPARLSVTAASGRIIAGHSETFTAQLTDKSGGVTGASVNLLERVAGQKAWRQAGTATTGANGTAVITAPDVTVNAAFRVSGPDGTLSKPVLVIVTPPVSARFSSSSAMTPAITASSPLAEPGNTVVLQVLAGKHWMNVQMAKLNGARQARFTVRSRLMQRRYRVVLLPTASHGLSVSNAVMVPPR